MRCLKNHIMILYTDQALPGRVIKKVEAHLSECPQCRANLKNIDNNLQLIMRKMEVLEPSTVPVPEIVNTSLQTTVRKQKIPRHFRYWDGKPILKPAYIVLIVLFISLLALILGIRLPYSGGKNLPLTQSFSSSHFAIHFIKMEEQPAQTYIVTDRETRTTLVWVEKMQ